MRGVVLVPRSANAFQTLRKLFPVADRERVKVLDTIVYFTQR
jgi:hypothetical protein